MLPTKLQRILALVAGQWLAASGAVVLGVVDGLVALGALFHGSSFVLTKNDKIVSVR
jgi:hypothetical protein